MAGPPPPTLHGVLPTGTVLNGYELKSVLGQGAFGITYRARDLTLHRDVAIKEYLPTSLALRDGSSTVVPRSPDHAGEFAWGCERFLEEARTLGLLDRTAAIVRVHGFFEANGTAYMVMSLVEGETLSKRLQREQRLTPEAIDRLLFPLLDGLEEVHRIGFLHRDIKPANIMIDGDGRPTLIDFGASRAAMAKRSTTLTAIFTPGYAAAEQFSSETLGQWTDIYGLAATLHHAITGRIPPSSIDRILNDTYEPLAGLQLDGYAPAILAAIDVGMSLRVDARPQSVAEWRQMLRPPQPSTHEATLIARKPRPLARLASRAGRTGMTARRALPWAAAAAGMALLVGGGYLALTADPATTVSAAALSLSVEQLEQALAERRKADALVGERRRLEEEARRKAEAETKAKRLADMELEAARLARHKAEQELVRLKADIEARRQADTGQREQGATIAERMAEETAQHAAEAETAALREAEAQAARKAVADGAAKEHADRALALAEAQREQAEAEARARATIETAEEKAAAAERNLRLEPADRERLQVALTALGFDTHGHDGVFGPRSREMIARWQKSRKQPATGFLTRAQREMLLAATAAMPPKGAEQTKIEEKAEAATLPAGPADGPWHGTYECGRNGNFKQMTLNMVLRLTDGAGTWYPATWSVTNDNTISVKVSVDGSRVTVTRATTLNSQSTTPLLGRVEGNTIRAGNNACTMVLTRGLPVTAAIAPAQRQNDAPPSPSLPSPDGSWRGVYKCGRGPQLDPAFNAAFVIDLKLQLANGSAIWRTQDPSQNNGQSFDVAVSVVRGTASVARTMLSRLGGLGGSGSQNTLTGRYDGSTINVTGQERSSGRDCTLALTRS